MKNYEINEETLAIISLGDAKTKILEKEKEYIIDKKAYSIMDENCQYYGSSYSGRLKAAKNILDCSYKLPILVEESSLLIFFPTKSSLVEDCWWINANAVKSIEKQNDKVIIRFNNDQKIEADTSKLSLQNQLYRSSKLESIIRKRILNEKG